VYIDIENLQVPADVCFSALIFVRMEEMMLLKSWIQSGISHLCCYLFLMLAIICE